METSSTAAAQDARYTLRERLVWRFVNLADPLAQSIAWLASKCSGVTGAGVFFYPTGSRFFAVWKDSDSSESWSLTARLGRIELVMDYRVSGQ